MQSRNLNSDVQITFYEELVCVDVFDNRNHNTTGGFINDVEYLAEAVYKYLFKPEENLDDFLDYRNGLDFYSIDEYYAYDEDKKEWEEEGWNEFLKEIQKKVFGTYDIKDFSKEYILNKEVEKGNENEKVFFEILKELIKKE